MTLMVTYQSL